MSIATHILVFLFLFSPEERRDDALVVMLIIIEISPALIFPERHQLYYAEDLISDSLSLGSYVSFRESHPEKL